MGARKRFLPSLAVLLILGGVPAFAGPVSITGTARCHMPDLLEMKTLPIAMERGAQTPDSVASSGPVEIKEEERSGAPKEEVMVAQAETDSDQNVIVYTICAK